MAVSNDVEYISIDDIWNEFPKRRPTFVDLFCGCGGASCGMRMAGFDDVCGLDFYKPAVQTYEAFFHTPVICGDITDPKVRDEFCGLVGRTVGRKGVDVLWNSFPCQGFSMSGHRDVNDSRNVLYKNALDIINVLKPKFVVCENVVGLRSMCNGNVEQGILEDYRECGYEISAATLCAADYRVPQFRKRVIFIANRIGARNLFPSPILGPLEYITMGDAISDLVSCSPSKGFNHVPSSHTADMVSRLASVPEGESLYEGKYSEAYYKSPWNRPSSTIKENHGGVQIHPRLPRVLTVREMARLQSFPDYFGFCGNKHEQQVQVGNAVPPLMAKAIGLAVLKSLEYRNEGDY